jgi:hypothetical protein
MLKRNSNEDNYDGAFTRFDNMVQVHMSLDLGLRF